MSGVDQSTHSLLAANSVAGANGSSAYLTAKCWCCEEEYSICSRLLDKQLTYLTRLVSFLDHIFDGPEGAEVLRCRGK